MACLVLATTPAIRAQDGSVSGTGFLDALSGGQLTGELYKNALTGEPMTDDQIQNGAILTGCLLAAPLLLTGVFELGCAVPIFADMEVTTTSSWAIDASTGSFMEFTSVEYTATTVGEALAAGAISAGEATSLVWECATTLAVTSELMDGLIGAFVATEAVITGALESLAKSLESEL